MRQLIVGPDFAMGRDREGTAEELSRLGEEFGYRLETVVPVEIDMRPVSSSRIRAALAEGDLQQVTQLLGRPYHVTGQVVPGDARGKTIGVPTANLSLWPERAIPKTGVYVTRAVLNGVPLGSVTNVGVRPTFTTLEDHPHVETHLLDYGQDIYGQELRLEFLTRLRDEQRFPDVESLVKQIEKDIASAREYFEGTNGKAKPGS
jgi:riboflavin kinase/FMN adenylyltransferase